MAARLRDVAQLAGVSVKTVSNVVNDHPHIKPGTRAKVEKAIAELGYRPNLSARQLKYGRSGFIALVVPELESPYFAELAARFSEQATKRGYMTLLETTGARVESEEAILTGLPKLSVDGIAFSPLALSASQIEKRASTVPMVLLGERAVPRNLPLVAVDSVNAARAMTEHLLALGRTRIAAIGRETKFLPSQVDGEPMSTASVRSKGYREALEAAGIAFDPELVIGVSEYSRAAGAAAMHELLARPNPPDAVFCFNDLMAIGAIRACHEVGLSVPGDIAIAGFDDIIEGRFSTPTLTTISPDYGQLVSSLLDELVARIEGQVPPDEGARVTVPWVLEARESTLGRGA